MKREPPGPRGVTLEVLSAMQERDAFLQPALQAAAHRAGLDSRDRGLALELSAGVLRWQAWLDHALDHYLSRGIAGTDPVLVWVLRIGAYQLLRLDRIPDRAAVHTAVDLGREVGGDGAAGMVNGVLRRLTRDGVPPVQAEGAARIAIEESQPEWLVRRWLQEGTEDEVRARCRAANKPAPLTLRAEGDRDALAERLRAEGGVVSLCTHAPQGLKLERLASPFTSASFREGLWQAQDEASQLVVELLGATEGASVWDACAAPGGKTRVLAQKVGPEGRVVATEVHANKAGRMRRALRHLPQVGVQARDAREVPGEFDYVLLDAPCTSLGVIRRHPEIKWRRSEADVADRVALQAELLEAVAAGVSPGGVLVYSVCSDLPDEGSAQIARFLAAHPEFSVAEPPSGLDWAPLLREGALHLRPDLHDTDGFYAARLRRQP